MIQVEQVTYGYKGTPVLKNISYRQNDKSITAIWGRNGAGKTTLMKLMAGHEKPDHGQVKIKGTAPYNRADVVQHICYVQEEHPFSSIWSIKDALRFGSYYFPNWNKELAKRLVKVFRLDEKKRITQLSKGMRSAVQFIIGLSSHAEITILDEPINGLDANMRKRMYRILRESHEEHPRLILLSSHHIEEIQAICESLVVIHDGNVLMHEPMDQVREYGIWLTGEEGTINKVTEGQRVFEEKRMGSIRKVLLDVPFNEEWKNVAHNYGLSIDTVNLQDYLLHITEEDGNK